MSEHHEPARAPDLPAVHPSADRPAEVAGFGRREFLRSAGLVTGGVAAGAAVGAAAAHAHTGRADGGTATAPSSAVGGLVPFHGTRQAGIVDRAPSQLRFTAYDLTETPRTATALRRSFQRLSSAAAELTAGRWIPEQSSVADGATPRRLTVTIGIGDAVIRASGATMPEPMAPIPAFPGERLDPGAGGGDLGIAVCGDDPLVTASAARALGTVLATQFRPRWTRSGFLPRPPVATPDATPRNLMGQLDGTDNPTGARQHLAVWVAPGTDVAWMAHGTYLVCRRIRMLLPAWERLGVAAKQDVIGRELLSGAPLTGGTEHSTPSFTAVGPSGALVIPADAHVRLTHPSQNSGATLFRRGYSYDDGYTADGQPNAGLFFQAFQSDPRAVFVPIQRRLATADALSRFIVHETSALFAVLPGTAAGGFIGETLFG